MRTPKITAKRVLGLTLAGALAVAGTIAVAQSSQAAVQSLKLSSATGGTAVRALSVTGTGFTNAAGVSQLTDVFFSTTACTTTATADVVTTANQNIVSSKKMTINTPATLAAGASGPANYFLCLTTGTGASEEVLGSAKYSVYTTPTFGATPLSKVSGPTWGAVEVTITGDDFTPKTRASIDDKLLTGIKVVVNSGATDDTLTGMLPAGTVGAKTVKVANEAGVVTLPVGAGTTFTYVSAVKVEPSSTIIGSGKAVTVTGTGFESKTFAATATPTASQSVVRLSPGAAVQAVGAPAAPPAGTINCGSVQVVSDTELSCVVAAADSTIAKSGSYTVQVLDFGTGGTPVVTVPSAVSADAAFTIAAF